MQWIVNIFQSLKLFPNRNVEYVAVPLQGMDFILGVLDVWLNKTYCRDMCELVKKQFLAAVIEHKCFKQTWRKSI